MISLYSLCTGIAYFKNHKIIFKKYILFKLFLKKIVYIYNIYIQYRYVRIVIVR